MNSIITTKERNRAEKTVWVSERYLLKMLDGLSEEYLRKKARYVYRETVSGKDLNKDCLPDTGAGWRYMNHGGEFYYDYERIPDKSPTMYRSQLGSKNDLMKVKPKKHDSLKNDVKSVIVQAIEKDYKQYLPSYREYDEKHCERLSKACAVITVLSEAVLINEIPEKDNKFWIMAAEILNELGIGYVPTNFRRLKEKVMPSIKGEKAIVEIIDLPRANNQNARKFDDKELESWVFQLRSMGQNYTNIWIIRKVQTMCTMTGKACPSEGWFNALFAKQSTKFLTAEGRYGKSGRRAQIYQGYVPIENALFAGDCWHVDATRVNMIPYIKKQNVDGKDLYREEFMHQIIVKDVYSGDIMGRHMDVRESATGYIMAVMISAKEQGYLPYEIVFDRFPGHNTDEWKLVAKRMEAMGVKVTVTHKAMGKAKLERWFGTLQSVFMQDSKYYYGQGIISNRPYAHRSSEYLYNMKKSARAAGWNFDEAWNEINEVIDRFRRTPYSEYSRKYKIVEESPYDLHQQSDKPNVVRLKEHEMTLIFGICKEITVRNAGLIRTEINRVEYVYEVNDYSVLSEKNKVILAYDFEDLSKVHLFEISEDPIPKYLCEAGAATSAKIYGPSADFEGLGKAKARIAGINEFRKDTLDNLTGESSEVDIMLGAMGNKEKVNEFEDVWNGIVVPEPSTEIKPDEDDEELNINDLLLGQM